MGCHKKTNNGGAQSKQTHITSLTQKLERCTTPRELHMSTPMQYCLVLTCSFVSF